MSNYYSDLYFFIMAAVAAALFRLAARRSPPWTRQAFLGLVSIFFLSKLTGFETFWPALALYLAVTLALGQAILAAEGKAKSRLLGAGCVLAVAALAAYKYADALPLEGWPRDAATRFHALHWIGLSYLTFKAIDYFVALRSGTRPAVSRPRHALYGLAYFLFFPVYISGPILRYQAYLKDQAAPWRPLTFLRLRNVVLRASIGVIKILLLGKWAYANSIATFDLRAGEPASLGALTLSLYFYYLYFYFDFSGYCDAAIALADVLEVRVPENFRFPFLATSPQDFWNRWHLTLSQWLRDLVFFRSLRAIFKRAPWFPQLAASTGSIFFTFVLMGLWHGDTWNWLVYGCYHGAALSLELVYRRVVETLCPDAYERAARNPAYKLLCMVLMFNFVAWGLLFTVPLENLRHVAVLFPFGAR